ncbi:serine hydrolase domain-containing protein [Streptacidiphilus cavernicola]|uniref:Beta-lactamase n=1 Tax=Streptacidiphilus cavernicola TaxID=3342716 RepID=A0ABV6VPI2_9ACTN
MTGRPDAAAAPADADPCLAPPVAPLLDPLIAPLLDAAPGATAVALAAVRGRDTLLRWTGTTDRAAGRAVDADTRFEIGSLSKTCTALLLAEAVARAEVRYGDPIARHLPSGTAPRHRSGEPITVLHLATHTSGLPRLPRGMFPGALRDWSGNPYGRYSEQQLFDSLATTAVRARPGTRVYYSNLGVGLLGHVLAGAAGTSYPELLRARVLDPLALTRTTGDAGCDQATGHWHGRPRPPWSIPALPGAGALRSSARDLLRYLQALIDPAGAGPLADALTDVQRPRLALPRTGDRICLVWNLRSSPGRDLFFHSGGTRGFTAFIGFCPQTRTGLAALANTTPTGNDAFSQAAYSTLRKLPGTPGRADSAGPRQGGDSFRGE